MKASSFKKNLKTQNVRVAIVWSRFNEEITRSLLSGAQRGLEQAGLKENEIDVFEVSGAFEVPLLAQEIAKTRKYSGIVCLGAVIRGDTPHFDYVCQAATLGILHAQLNTGIPMAFGIITTDTIQQAIERSGPGDDNKGFEAAQVVVEIIDQLEKVRNG